MRSTISIVPLKQKFLCFTLDTDEELAKRTFRSRFGYEPEQVITDDFIRVGPVKEEAPSGGVD